MNQIDQTTEQRNKSAGLYTPVYTYPFSYQHAL